MILFVDSKVLKLADLNEEFDQGALCRIDPLPPCPRSIRHKTVFVEGLPKDATVQWLEALVKALSESTPSFITIPRHKKGNSCGYAFLEFESSKAAQKVHAGKNCATVYYRIDYTVYKLQIMIIRFYVMSFRK